MATKEQQKIVYQGQPLIESAYNLTLDETRLLFLALSKIGDSRKPQPDGTYTLYPDEFERMFSTNPSNTHRQLQAAVDSLALKPIITYELNKDLNRIDKIKRFWFSQIVYDANNGNSDVTIRFSEQVAPYLYELKQKFTRLNMYVISNLETPFSYRLYSWLVSYKELEKNKTANGVIVTDPIGIDWMRERAGLTGKTYEEYRFFRRDVLEPAIKHINEKTDLTINEDFDVIKHGRRVTSVVFSYIVEDLSESSFVPPSRPRLPRRPHVSAGSAKEGDWARACLDLMKSFKAKCEERKGVKGLTNQDIKKMINWYLIIGDKFNAGLLKEQLNTKTRSRSKKDMPQEKI